MQTPYFRPTDRRMISRCRFCLMAGRTCQERLNILNNFAHKYRYYAYKTVKDVLPGLIKEHNYNAYKLRRLEERMAHLKMGGLAFSRLSPPEEKRPE